MPIWIFLPAASATGLFIFPLSPAKNEGNVPVNRDFEFGLFCSGGFAPDFSSINVTIDGSSAIVMGVEQPGFSYSYEEAIFDVGTGDEVGRVFTVVHDTPWSPDSLVSATVEAKDVTETCDESKTWSFTTSDGTAFRAYAQWGNPPEGRFLYLRTPTSSSQDFGVLVGQDNITVEALMDFSGREFGALTPQVEIRLDNVLGTPSTPPVHFGPLFAATASSPHSKQIGPIKLQPQTQDGYFFTTELEFALVNFGAAFGDFEDAIDMASADAAGAFPLPTAYWSMDNSDLVGTTLIDTVGGHNGTLTNTPTTGVSGQVQQTFTFALASSEFIDMGSVTELDWGSGDGSVGAWFNTSTNYSTAGIDGNIVANGAANAGGFRYHLHITDNSTNLLAFTIDDNTSLERVSTAVTVNDGEWHHGVGVREGTNIKLYLDGVLVDTEAIGAYGSLDDANGFRVGAIYDTVGTAEDAFFDGEIDEAFVLTGQALTAEQVFEIYSLGATNQKLVS